jgi:hypothetical protein
LPPKDNHLSLHLSLSIVAQNDGGVKGSQIL